MKIYNQPEQELWSKLCERPQLQLDYLENAVQSILTKVKNSGDKALSELTKQFDQVEINEFKVTPSEIDSAINEVPDQLKKAIERATGNIEKFHAAQKLDIQKIETSPGVICWRKASAIEKIGIYIPGGSAPLFSTVLMLAIPAKLAGCNDVILCTPPERSGKINSTILYAAHLTGVSKIFKVGGAQAIAGMAYGTESIPKVYKIVGPGNQYVTKAKQLVSMQGVAIDLPAGPSEVMVIADATSNSSFVAADLLSQAEHGEDSQVVLLSSDSLSMEKILREVDVQLNKLPRKEIARKALSNSLGIILNKNQIIDFANDYAPEHLIINTEDCDELGEQIRNAGSIFLGAYTPESAGDYASGTNHTLPTNGFAKNFSGVSLGSFMKYVTVQKISRAGLKSLGPSIELMAEAEYLRGHAEAVRIRYKERKRFNQ